MENKQEEAPVSEAKKQEEAPVSEEKKQEEAPHVVQTNADPLQDTSTQSEVPIQGIKLI